MVENTSVLCIEDSSSGIPHKAANFFTFLPSYVGLMASNSTAVFQYPDFCTFNFNLKKGIGYDIRCKQMLQFCQGFTSS